MWRYWRFQLLLTVLVVVSSAGSLPKCCKENQSMVSTTKQGWVCQIDPLNRVIAQYESNINATKCVEASSSGIYSFWSQNHHFDRLEAIPILTKCCNVNYTYNPSTRSCVPGSNPTTQGETYTKFGLPHCRIISDLSFNDSTSFDVEKGILFLRDTTESFAEGEFCVDENTNGGVSMRVCREMGVCERTRCIRKCCPDGQSFVNGSFCENTYVHGLRFQQLRNFVGNITDDFAIIHDYPGPGKVANMKLGNTNYSLDQQGIFYNHVTNLTSLPSDQIYCIEHAEKNNKTYGHIHFLTLPSSDPPLSMKFLTNRAAMIVSGIFLVLTIMFYVCTRALKKAFAKAMVSFCLALLALYTMLIYSTFDLDLHRKRNRVACKVVGFSIIYLSFCCFVWLQIISFDIYWTFGSTKTFTSRSEKSRKVLKRFLLYSVYGWGVPLLITAFPAFFHFFNVLPAPIEVKMGNTKCAIERNDENYAEILFRTIPLTVIQTVNMVLFFKTITYCIRVKNEIKKMSDCALNANKKRKFFARRERFQLVLKLSLIMGISYIFEVLSSFVDFKINAIASTIEVLWDFINCLQGLFIFLILVCKKKNLMTCKQTAAFEKIRKISLSSTRTTNVSTETKKCGKSKSNIADAEPKKTEDLIEKS